MSEGVYFVDEYVWLRVETKRTYVPSGTSISLFSNDVGYVPTYREYVWLRVETKRTVYRYGMYCTM